MNKLIFIFLFCFVTGFLSATDCIADGKDEINQLRIATFDVDATPPVGSNLAYQSMINNWDLGLRAKGIVLQGSGQPIVLCCIDWIGISNDSQDIFKETLARAAQTVPERVAVHTVHQHDAPISDFGAEKLLIEKGLDPMGYESSFDKVLLMRLEEAVGNSLEKSKQVTHLGLGKGKVYNVASNRRILGTDGKVRATRGSSCRDSALRSEPEGLIDPIVSLISFWNNDEPLAVLSYYACHPQSYYLTSIANPDFPGIARFYRQLAVPNALHIHFNGAGGNIAAGKYNDGSKEKRFLLAERLADGMKRAWETTKKESVTADDISWVYDPLSLPPAPYLKDIEQKISPDNYRYLTNNLFKLVWLRRLEKGKKINISCLGIGKARILHMPGELCIEYQLAAKKMRPDLFITMAAYGDYATGYICTAKAYEEGGYEAGPASAVTYESEQILMDSMKKLLNQ